MRIVIIGGTGFIGPWVVRHLVGDGHVVAVFHRGHTAAGLPLAVAQIKGDRQNLSAFAAEFTRFAPDVVLQARRGYFLFKDDGSGTAKQLLWAVEVDDGFGGDGHGSFVPGSGGDWIISDTYNIH